ncbi:uncharacterized protein LOC144123026 [Amblyomma americanum]
MEQSVIDESVMLQGFDSSQMSFVQPSPGGSENETEERKQVAVVVCCTILLLLLLIYVGLSTLLIEEEPSDDKDKFETERIYASSGTSSRRATETDKDCLADPFQCQVVTDTQPITAPSPRTVKTMSPQSTPPAVPWTTPGAGTTPTTTTTTYRPYNSQYVRKSISGLLCHTELTKYLTYAVPGACDFFVADINISTPSRHPHYSPYMATVQLADASQAQAAAQRIRQTPGKGLILMVDRSALRPPSPQARPQAVVRGVLQIVTDINADGVGLNDRSLRAVEIQQVKADADILSDEMRQYHGLYRHEAYSGPANAFHDLVKYVSTRASLVFVYRVWGRSTFYTSPYYTNFFMRQKNDVPVSEHIKRDVADPLSQMSGHKAVAVSLSLKVRKCNMFSLDGNQQPNCTELPLDYAHICTLYPAYVQTHYYSVMTRRWKGFDEVDMTDIYFYEVEETVSRKAYLMAMQLKTAGIQTIAFIIEQYEMDANSTVTTLSFDQARNVPCKVHQFGITNRTKLQLRRVL